jgi:hypothetical protein
MQAKLTANDFVDVDNALTLRDLASSVVLSCRGMMGATKLQMYELKMEMMNLFLDHAADAGMEDGWEAAQVLFRGM